MPRTLRNQRAPDSPIFLPVISPTNSSDSSTNRPIVLSKDPPRKSRISLKPLKRFMDRRRFQKSKSCLDDECDDAAPVSPPQSPSRNSQQSPPQSPSESPSESPSSPPRLVESSSSTEDHDPSSVPVEVVSVFEDSSGPGSPVRLKDSEDSGNDQLEVAQAEANEYLHHLRNTQTFVDQLTNDLNRSRMQVAELLGHNQLLMDELKSVSGRNDGSDEEVQLLEQELFFVKAGLFCGAIFLCCGGRAAVMGVITMGLLFVQLVA